MSRFFSIVRCSWIVLFIRHYYQLPKNFRLRRGKISIRGKMSEGKKSIPKSLQIKAYCSKLLKILCNSIFKDIWQFKSGLPIYTLNLSILFRSKVWWNLKIPSRSERMVYFIWGFIIFFYSQTLINWTRRTIKKWKHYPFHGSSLRNCRIT